MSTASTRHTTAYLKGAAIIVVMIGHYSSYYAVDFYTDWFREYASEIVSIFFVLAGYGALHSFSNLEEQKGEAGLDITMILRYYGKKALRIYPLYWTALFTVAFILPEYGRLHELSLHTVATYLAYPGVKAPGVYWFIPALIQCYLLAPMFYILIRRLRLRHYLMAVAMMLAMAMVVTNSYHRLLEMVNGFGIPDPDALLYRPLFLANVILFALGMAIPLLVAGNQSKKGGYFTFAGALTLFLAMMLAVRDADTIFTRSHFFLFPLFIFSVFALCWSLLRIADPVLPLLRLVGPLGNRSYPIYLFHRQYFGLLAMAGAIGGNSLKSIALTILLLPLFFIACALMEDGFNRAGTRMTRRWLFPGKAPAALP